MGYYFRGGNREQTSQLQPTITDWLPSSKWPGLSSLRGSDPLQERRAISLKECFVENVIFASGMMPIHS